MIFTDFLYFCFKILSIKFLSLIAFEATIFFGGLLSTGGDITIATGTTDNKVIIIDSENGKKLWEKKLEFAGSSPPMTYIYDGEQYIIINASGGRYYGYENILGDAIYAFKIL